MNPDGISYPKKIAVLYSDARREYFPTEQLYISEAEVKDRATLVATYLQRLHFDTALFPGDTNVSQNLQNYQPDFVFNLVDSVYGHEYLAATIPAALELLKVPYTGTGIMGQTINTNKYFTKNLLEQYGITTPKYQLIKEPCDEIDEILDYPLISKLNEVHGSIEMDDSAISQEEKSLDQRIKYLMKTYKQPVLLEEFIVGREISVFVIEGLNTKVYAGEKIFNPKYVSGRYKIVSFDANWEYEDAISYQKYELPPRVKNQVKTAFEVLKLEDYAKFDFRVDESGRHYLIDVNSNPALGPKEADCAIGRVLDLYNIPFEEVLSRIIDQTLREGNGNGTGNL